MPINMATTLNELRNAIQQIKQENMLIGFVPTMGALHAGHISLIRAARQEADYVVVSIFVNPTQFGPHEDLDKYPRDLETDKEICTNEGVDLIFVPTQEMMYPQGFRTYVEVIEWQELLCGKSRPSHFRGVTTIVLKLFNLVQADVAYFGQKDAQQCRIIQKMVQDLHVPIEIRMCPIIREEDGLACSSRNQYLNEEERQQATILYQSLKVAEELIAAGERNPATVRERMVEMIESKPAAELDYAEIVDFDTLQPLDQLHGEVLIALAVKFGSTRLIDNTIVAVKGES